MVAETVTIDRVSFKEETDEFILSLLESGPWPEDDFELSNECKRVERRLGLTADFVIDGRLCDSFPDSRGKPVVIQVFSPFGLPNAIQASVRFVAQSVEQERVFQEAIEKSPFMASLRIMLILPP